MRSNVFPVKSVQVLVINVSLAKGILRAGMAEVPCLLGRSGMTRRKREGDGKTPVGAFALTGILYRADRLKRLPTPRTMRPIRPHEAWCDRSGHRCYNRLMKKGLPGSEEHLWRKDNAYDVMAILDYNQKPRVQGLGSAVFFHLIRPGAIVTAGCVAVSPDAMRKLVPRLGRKAVMRIGRSDVPRKWHFLP
jgi:L,D-peptidoglycan transpeptidase YkuD (ErfK/YbiS/YcfS/YnhG family)